MSIKLLSVWVLGSVLLLLAVWIVQNLEMVVGVTEPSYLIALGISFVLILLAGLCWISVSVATRRKFL